jgi:hypothetical protein
MGIREEVRRALQGFPAFWRCFARWRARRDESNYRYWREYYQQSRWSPTLPTKSSTPRKEGEIRTFAVIPSWSWHTELLGDLRSLGPVVHFDYALDLPWNESNRFNRKFFEWRERGNRNLLLQFEEEHRKAPFDWVFAYAQGDHLLASTVRQLRDRFKVPTVNMCLDDKNSWGPYTVGGLMAGSRALAGAFDWWWTSARVCVDWVHAEGGHAVYMPEGCAADLYPEAELPYSIPISFVGSPYGARLEMVRFLRRNGIAVQTFGAGWSSDSYVSQERRIEIYRTSQISLGHGGIGYSEAILNVKGRDFDIPCSGGGAYLTTFNPDLAQHFRVGEEILCWHSYDDLLEQVRYFLKRPEECRDMARRARARALREHRWGHRYKTILQRIGVLVDSEASK